MKNKKINIFMGGGGWNIKTVFKNKIALNDAFTYQGTILGPILFIIMIYDLCKDLLVSVPSKYEDDMKNTTKIGNTD